MGKILNKVQFASVIVNFHNGVDHWYINLGKPTASALLADGFLFMAGPNFQPSDGNPTVILIIRQLADGPDYVPEM